MRNVRNVRSGLLVTDSPYATAARPGRYLRRGVPSPWVNWTTASRRPGP
ncbi:hypothetical protein [Streptomyces sp. NBC_01278]